MKYCFQCHRITTGDPLFCNYCGRSYEVKLCPRLHPNSRSAEVCSQCGSRDLSTPHPRTPLWLVPLLSLLRIFPGVVLLLVSIAFVVAFVQTVFTNPALLGRFLFLALFLGLLWWLYMQLPGFVRRTIHRGMQGVRRRGRRDGRSDHR